MIKMPPDIVIRSAGVWNCRSPFHLYLREYKKINRSYSLSILAALRVQRDIQNGNATSIRQYFNPREGHTKLSDPRELKAWTAYKKALGRLPSTGEFRSPTADEIYSDTEQVVAAVRRASLISHVSLWEQYLQCWALNHLLAKLENGTLWANDERLLASKLSPIHTTDPEPSATYILRCLPMVQGYLKTVPYRLKDPETKEPILLPVHDNDHVLVAARFWTDFRNLLVHRNGWITKRFFDKYCHFWQYFFQSYKHIPALRTSTFVLIYHEMIELVGVNLYRAAKTLSDELEIRSGGRRGQPWAPEPRETIDETPEPKPLLLPGDHELSYKWASDNTFRESFIIDNKL